MPVYASSYRPILQQLPPGLHPLDATDRPVIESLLLVSQPSDRNLVDTARLLSRYRGATLSPDLWDKLQQALGRWGLTEDELNTRARVIWASGWRPSMDHADAIDVGSGADVEG